MNKIKINTQLDIDGFLTGVKKQYYLFVFIEEYVFRLFHVGVNNQLSNTLKLKHNNQLFDLYLSNDNRLAFQPIELKKSQDEDGHYYIDLEIIDTCHTNKFIFTPSYKRIYDVSSDETENILIENFMDVNESTIFKSLNFYGQFKELKGNLVCYAYKNGSVFYPEPLNVNFVPTNDNYNLLTGIFFDGLTYSTISFNNLIFDSGIVDIVYGDEFNSNLIVKESSFLNIIVKSLEDINYTVVPVKQRF